VSSGICAGILPTFQRLHVYLDDAGSGFPSNIARLHVYQNACRLISSHIFMAASYLSTKTKFSFIAFTLKS